MRQHYVLKYDQEHETDLLHFMKDVNEATSSPRVQGGDGNGFDIRDKVPDSIRGQGALHQLPQASMVLSLVEKQGRWSYHLLLAFWVCGLEQVRLSHKHEL